MKLCYIPSHLFSFVNNSSSTFFHLLSYLFICNECLLFFRNVFFIKLFFWILTRTRFDSIQNKIFSFMPARDPNLKKYFPHNSSYPFIISNLIIIISPPICLESVSLHPFGFYATYGFSSRQISFNSSHPIHTDKVIQYFILFVPLLTVCQWIWSKTNYL